MCLATVYVEDDGQREEVMRDVAWIEPANGGLLLTTLLGESKQFRAQIESIDLLHSLIVLKRIIAAPGTGPGDRKAKSAPNRRKG